MITLDTSGFTKLTQAIEYSNYVGFCKIMGIDQKDFETYAIEREERYGKDIKRIAKNKRISESLKNYHKIKRTI